MIRKILYIALLFISIQSWGQDEVRIGKVFVSNNFKGDGIAVKWIAKNIYFPEGSYVYRTTDGENWKKLNSTPVQFTQFIPEPNPLSERAVGLYNYTRGKDYQEFQEDFMRAFVLIEAIYDANLAEVMGITYYDTEAKPGVSYTYKVIASLNGKDVEVGISPSIEVASYKAPMPPKEIKIERTRGYANFSWKPETDRYYGVDIFRKSKKEKEFSKITEQPFAVQKNENAKGEMVYLDVFIQDSILDEEEYTYQLKAIDYFGQSSEFSDAIELSPKDFSFPEEPFNIMSSTVAKDLKVSITWEAVEDENLQGYNVYKTNHLENEFIKVNQSLLSKSDKSIEDQLSQSGDYYYKVSTVNKSGNESFSGVVLVNLRDMQPPMTPSNFKAMADTGKISFSWDANTEGDLAGYVLQKSLNDNDNSDNYFSNVTTESIGSNSYTESISKNIRNKFVYRVIAIDTNFNKSEPSSIVMAQLPDAFAPRVPVIKTIVNEGDNVKLSWIPNVEEDLTGYHVYKKVVGDSAFEKVNVNIVREPIASYIDRRVEPEVLYEYMVCAVDEAGNVSSFSEPFKFKFHKDLGESHISFTYSKLVKNKKQVELIWKNENENYAMAGYVVYKTDHTGVMKPVTGMLKEPHFKDKLEINKPVQYQVRGYATTGKVVQSEILDFILNVEN